MSRLKLTATIVTTAAIGWMAAAPSLQARPQDAPPKAAEAMESATLIHSAGLENILVDPKDKGLLRALRMVDERIAELPAELDDPDMPVSAMQFIWEVLTSPMSMRAGMRSDDDPNPGMGPPFYAQLNIHTADADDAASFNMRFLEVVKLMDRGGRIAAPRPMPSMPGMMKTDMGGAEVMHGSTKIGNESNFVLAMGKFDADPVDLAPYALGTGSPAAFAFMMDFKQLQPVLQMIAGQAGPQGQVFMQQLAMSGMAGEHPATILASMGYTADRSISKITLLDYVHALKLSNAYSDGRVSDAELRLVPVDATFAQVGHVNPKWIATMLRTAAAQMHSQMGRGFMDEEDEEDHDADWPGAAPQADPIQQLADMTGIHLEKDITDKLGTSMGFYLSDTTGGGSLASLIGFFEVIDQPGLTATMDKIQGMINGLAKEHARGYIQMRKTKVEGSDTWLLQFPGIPVPVEISMGFAGKHLFVALSPQALVAARMQATAPKSSLLANPAFTDGLKTHGGHNNAIRIDFIDTNRMARSGYGTISAAMAALTNAVRSPSNPDRDPGIIMLPFNELMANVKASVGVTRVEGDNIVANYTGDRSVMVNACGFAGVATTFISAAAALGFVGGTMPALGQARSRAEELKAAAQARQLNISVITWSAGNADALPPNFEIMVEQEYFGAGLLASPYGPVFDGNGDYWLNTAITKLSAVERPDRTILLYDRASFSNHGQVIVAFVDGHVETLSHSDFLDLTSEEQHEDIDFKIPGW